MEENFKKIDKKLTGKKRSTKHIWLISYSDFMTILMIFFLAMYGYTYLAKANLISRSKKITYSEFAEKVSLLKEDLESEISIEENIHKVTVQMPSGVLFASGQATLTKQAERTIEELSKSIKLVTGDIIVEGHTDNVPISKGPYKSNWELSAARAFSVIEELTENGVQPQRLSAWGFGENRPMMTNKTIEGRGKNRRIEIVLIKKGEKKEEG